MEGSVKPAPLVLFPPITPPPSLPPPAATRKATADEFDFDFVFNRPHTPRPPRRATRYPSPGSAFDWDEEDDEGEISRTRRAEKRRLYSPRCVLCLTLDLVHAATCVVPAVVVALFLSRVPRAASGPTGPLAILLVVALAVDALLDLQSLGRLGRPWEGWALLSRIVCGLVFVVVFVTFAADRGAFPAGYGYWGLPATFASPFVYVFLWTLAAWDLFHVVANASRLAAETKRYFGAVSSLFTTKGSSSSTHGEPPSSCHEHGCPRSNHRHQKPRKKSFVLSLDLEAAANAPWSKSTEIEAEIERLLGGRGKSGSVSSATTTSTAATTATAATTITPETIESPVSIPSVVVSFLGRGSCYYVDGGNCNCNDDTGNTDANRRRDERPSTHFRDDGWHGPWDRSWDGSWDSSALCVGGINDTTTTTTTAQTRYEGDDGGGTWGPEDTKEEEVDKVGIAL